MSLQTNPTTSNRIANFCLVEEYNKIIDTQEDTDFGLVYLTKKIASVALLIIAPLNVLLLPFIALWNCFCATDANQPNLPSLSGRAVPLQPQGFDPKYALTADGKLAKFRVMGANTLKANENPYEFNGELDARSNAIRTDVWNRIVCFSNYYKNVPEGTKDVFNHSGNGVDSEVNKAELAKAAKAKEKTYGPTFSELVNEQFVQTLKECFPNDEAAIDQLKALADKFKDVHVFGFFHNSPIKIAFDKIINDGLGDNTLETPPILSSTHRMHEVEIEALKELCQYMAAIPAEMVNEKLSQKKLAEIEGGLNKYDQTKLQEYLGDTATKADLEIFCTPFGQKLFYMLYHWHHRALVQDMIPEVNKLNEAFKNTLADPVARANTYVSNIQENRFGVVMIQEISQPLIDGLSENFWPIGKQTEGTEGMDSVVFLHKKLWKENYEVISFETYKDKKKITMVVAESITGEFFAFAACHGDSQKAEDGREQLTHVMDAFWKLKEKHPGIQLVLSTDANTKKKDEVAAFTDHATSLNFDCTDSVPTCFKQRMDTTQPKSGTLDSSACDFLLTASAKAGGIWELARQRVGYKETQENNSLLPNLAYPSDHFPRSATLKRVTFEADQVD